MVNWKQIVLILLGTVTTFCSTGLASEIVKHHDEEISRTFEEELDRADQIGDSFDLSNDILMLEDSYMKKREEKVAFLEDHDFNELENSLYPEKDFRGDSEGKDLKLKTSIMLAVERDDTAAAEALFESGADIYQPLDSDKINLLHYAASYGSINCLRWLVERGLGVNETDEAREWTALHHAVFHRKLQAVKVLLELESCIACKDRWGFSPLKRAIQEDDVAIAAVLAESGANINEMLDSDVSLLHYAASNGSVESIKWLVEKGLNVNLTDESRQWIPLHHAAFHGKVEAVKVLLDLKSCVSCKDKWGFPPLARAIQHDDTDIAEIIRKSGADVNESLESNTINLLHFAATNGSPKSIRWLVALGLNVNTTDANREWIPLHHAVFHGKLQAAKVLLELKSCISCKDKWDYSPIRRAVQRDDVAIATVLVESGADIKQHLNSEKVNLLHYAASTDSTNAIRWLVEKGLDVNETDTARGWIPLHHAVYHGKLQAVKVLLELKSCISCMDKWDFSPIRRAVQRDHVAIASALVESGADIKQYLNSEKVNLLHYAASTDSKNAIRWLVEKGLDVNETDLARGWIPLHHAVYHGKVQAAKVLLELKSCISCKDKWDFSPIRRAVQRDDVGIAIALVELGADIKQYLNPEKVNLLHYAASTDSTNSIRWLVEKGLDVNETDMARGWTPLHHAVFHGKLQAAKVLLELKSCNACKDKWGFTPIMRAVQRDDVAIAAEIVKSGVDLKQNLDADKITLLHFAASSGSPHSIRWLVDRGLDVNDIDEARKWIPLHHAVFHGKLLAVNVLLELKSCVSCKDKWDFTPIMRAVQRDDVAIAAALVKAGADLNERLEANKITLLHFAASSGSPDSIRWLVGRGLDVNGTDVGRQWIPLHHAAYLGKLQSTKVLVDLQSCINCRGLEGSTPLHLALKNNHLQVVDFLRSVDGRE